MLRRGMKTPGVCSGPPPGATTSRSQPRLLKLESASSAPIEPTVRTREPFSGLRKRTSSLRLPADVTTETPSASTISSTSSASGFTGHGEPQDQLLLTTLAPFSAAYSTARQSVESLAEPSAGNPLSAMMRTPGATPTMPIPLPPTAAIVPATCVPCPLSSKGSASETSSGPS